MVSGSGIVIGNGITLAFANSASLALYTLGSVYENRRSDGSREFG